MSSAVAGIDPHQHSITVGIIDLNGVELTHQTFPTSSAGYLDTIDLLRQHDVGQVGVEGSASWGAHTAIALVETGFDAREVPRATNRCAASSAPPRENRCCRFGRRSVA